MNYETDKILEEAEYELFESAEHASTRAMLNVAPQNDGKLEDIGIIFARMDEFEADMHEFVNCFIGSPIHQ
jgi:hypothetical protein